MGINTINITIGMIMEYFTVEARHIKINNGKQEFKIIYQQANWWPPISTPNKPTNIQISTGNAEE